MDVTKDGDCVRFRKPISTVHAYGSSMLIVVT
jgi:hypothetical protein